METLLKVGIGVQFVTKAIVPANFIKLFAGYSDWVCAQVEFCHDLWPTEPFLHEYNLLSLG